MRFADILAGIVLGLAAVAAFFALRNGWIDEPIAACALEAKADAKSAQPEARP